MIDNKNFFVTSLLKWWKKNKRDFPWRKTNDPYKILIAEIMLQRTKAEQVKPVYTLFINKYQTPEKLASAKENDLAEILRPLGLAYRTKRFLDIGKLLMNNFQNKVPKKESDLITLPGVGPYIANAVLCFAYNKEVPLIDTNILRVLNRVFSIEISTESHKNKGLWEMMTNIVPCGNASTFYFSLLDFASAICKKKNPIHNLCPLKNICDYFLNY